jgi:hypothetical protein
VPKAVASEREKALSELAGELHDARTREAAAKQARITVEGKIAALVQTEEKGQKTVSVPGWKVTVKRGLIYTTKDFNALKGISVEGEEYFPPIKVKTETVLDEKGYEWYHENNDKIYTGICKHVEVKPKKTAVTIKPAK